MTEELCICTEPIVHCGKYPCGHIMCDRCTLRLRMIMQDKSCPFCREEADTVSLLESPTDELTSATFLLKSAGIICATEKLKQNALHLSRLPCPECNEETGSIKSLRIHVQKAHKRSICGVCAQHKFEFSDEFRLFSANAIDKHLAKEHEHCTLCKKPFFGSEELAKHCREKHEACFICARQNPGAPHHYANYDMLFSHFRSQHHCCPVDECVADRFVVFSSALELQDHMLERHRELVGSGRRARHVDMDLLHSEPAGRNQTRGTSNSSGGFTNTRNSRQNRSAAPTLPTPVEGPEIVARRRYEERLKIAIQQDETKLQQIEDANNSFATKFVPPMVFWATYQRLIPDAEDSTILALFADFIKYANLDDDRQNSLQLFIRQKTGIPEPPQPSPPTQSSSASAGANKPKTFASQVGTSAPKVVAASIASLQNPNPRLPQAVQPTRNIVSAVWGSSASTSRGRLDLQNLPKLGQPGPDQKKPSFLSKPSAIASTRSTAVKSKKQVITPGVQPHGLWSGGNQTRIPHASRAEALASWIQNAPASKSPSAKTAAASAALANLTLDSNVPSDASTSQASEAGSSQAKFKRPRRQPALALHEGQNTATSIFARPPQASSKSTKQNGGKPGKVNVIRIV